MFKIIKNVRYGDILNIVFDVGIKKYFLYKKVALQSTYQV